MLSLTFHGAFDAYGCFVGQKSHILWLESYWPQELIAVLSEDLPCLLLSQRYHCGTLSRGMQALESCDVVSSSPPTGGEPPFCRMDTTVLSFSDQMGGGARMLPGVSWYTSGHCTHAVDDFLRPQALLELSGVAASDVV